jgi:hypothetical protein
VVKRLLALIAAVLSAAAGAVVTAQQPAQAEPYGDFAIIGWHSGKCLDVIGAGQGDGVRIQQWTCNGNWQQIWQFNYLYTDAASGWRVFEVKSKHTGYAKCLDVRNGVTGNGAEIQQWSCNGLPQQKWLQEPVLGHTRYYRYHPVHVNRADICLDVRGVSPNDGARLQLWSCIRTNNLGNGNQVFYT